MEYTVFSHSVFNKSWSALLSTMRPVRCYNSAANVACKTFGKTSCLYYFSVMAVVFNEYGSLENM